MTKQYVMSERAHFMCPNMHFGMIVELGKTYDKAAVETTLGRMAAAHPFLKALIACEAGTDKLYYRVTEVSQIQLAVKGDEASLWADYRKVSEKDWNVFENGLLKVYIYPGESGMTLLLVAHHLLTDGRGLVELAEEFANDYVGGIAPVFVEEALPESIADLPEKSSLAGMSKLLVKQANGQWRKENQRVSYEQYASFVEGYAKAHPVTYETYEVEPEAVAEMVQLCRNNGFTMNDLLMAQMYLRTGAEKIIIAADIRNRLPKYRQGAMGNYSTAMGIVCKSKATDVVEKAKAVHKAVTKHVQSNRSLMLVLACYFEMESTLLDAAAISGLGGFDSKAGRLVGGGMFGFGHCKFYSITNLGKVENVNIESLMFIPPASPAAKFTLGVVTLNGRMKACSSKYGE